ncbi:uncharacterized protein LOC116262482 [Nymphaea colorata]|nr:uncharacterized protein LOC116262482 [Nymphaea colorata]
MDVEGEGAGGGEPISISLRPLQLTDVDDVLQWTTDPQASEFCLWDTHTCREDAVAFIRDFAIPHPWCRAICANGRPIGSISVSIAAGGAERCRGEIGYVLSPGYWGKGITTSVVRSVAPAAFRELPGLERIQGLVASENIASQRVLEKCGFQKEGLLRKYMFLKGRVRDIVVFSILREDVLAGELNTDRGIVQTRFIVGDVPCFK